MRIKIRIDTLAEVQKFVRLIEKLSYPVYLTDSKGTFNVNAKSILGVLYSLEFDDLWCVCPDHDIYFLIEDFVI